MLTLAVGMTPLSFAADAQPAKVTGLQITTANKQKLLKLAWDKQAGADGYQIYRSETGKTGSYQKIASVRDKTAYVDKGLKAAKTYYYKVRAFAKQNGKILFGGFAKASLSTKPSIRFLQKKLEKANRLNIDWILHGEEAYASYDWTDTKPIPGEDSEWLRYVYVKSDRFHSVSELKKAASRCFVKSTYEKIINRMYADIDGKLYRKSYDVGGDGGSKKAELKIVRSTDTTCCIKVISFDDYYDEDNNAFQSIASIYHLVYQDGIWVFKELMDDYGLRFYGSAYWI